MIVNINEIAGKIIRDTEVYQVEDNNYLEHLVLSKTTLHPDKETKGHSHPGKDEVYFFISGEGEIQINEEKKKVSSGDIVLIPHGAFHKVFNQGNKDLTFICVFEKYQR